MDKKLLIFSLIILSSLFSGCLIFHRISIEIELESEKSGTAKVFVNDIRSDAAGENELAEDKNNLFKYMLSSNQFISDMSAEGKQIISRELTLNEDTLNAQVIYKFDDIAKVEGIVHESGFYYLTLPLEDVIISTNGQVIESDDYKRILWDDKTKILKFEMLSFSFVEDSYQSMAQFYSPN